jgi:hypothetical protein
VSSLAQSRRIDSLVMCLAHPILICILFRRRSLTALSVAQIFLAVLPKIPVDL